LISLSQSFLDSQEMVIEFEPVGTWFQPNFDETKCFHEKKKKRRCL